MPQVLITPKVEAAETPIQAVSIDDLITESAKRYGVSREHLYNTLKCESKDFTALKDQSDYPNKNGPNGKENSWGVAQFNLPSDLKTADGRTVDMAIAIDPAQAIDAAAYNFSIGRAKRWSCFRMLYA